MIATLDKITGTVDRFLFQNQDNGFVVFLLSSKTETITIKGYLPSIQAGQEVELEGSWVFHKKFGRQFNAEKCISHLPSTVLGLKKYLGSGLIKGIGKIYAEKLVKHFGTDILTVIDETPARLQEVDGIGKKRVQIIAEAWKDQKEIANIMVFLQEKDISPTYAAKIYKKYGQESIALLHDNPYRLADDIWGIGFKTADTIATKLGFAHNHPKRLAAGIVFALTTASNRGHLYQELEQLRTDTVSLLGLANDEHTLLKKAFHDLYHRNKIKIITKDNVHYIGLMQYYLSELGVAKKLAELKKTPSKHSFDIQSLYQQIRVQNGAIQLNEKQLEGILSVLQNKISIITGGPGTGKTTLIKALLHLLDQEKISYKLAAPTGRAAKRMMEGTGRYAATIHRLLEFDVRSMSFLHNENNALKLDFLIVDEASMIDIFLAHAIIKALPHTAHIVFIGDIDQLPSVGPGNLLKDLISSSCIACTQLTEIFRQAQDSMIIVNAHRVNHGDFPTSSRPNARHDFKYFKEKDAQNIMPHIKRSLFIELKKAGIPLHEAQILVPMNRGAAGTFNLNHELQQLLNPGKKPSLARAGFVFKEKDRVMQIRNNYDKNVFNGDIGIIDRIDEEEKTVDIVYGDRLVSYELDELNEIVLSYACTIHKSQGSEYLAVIIPIFMQHFTLLQRNLIYTAITRAKKLCILIGDSRAIAMAIKNNKTIQRITFLKDFLKESLGHD